MKNLLVYYKYNHMEAGLRQKFRAEFFDKKFSLKVLPPIDFSMVILTVVDNMLQLRFANTSMTVLVFIFLYRVA